jgi:hypothetical protein
VSVFEGLIIGFIILSILWHVWKGGAANPTGTGTLGREVSGLSNKVSGLSGRVGHLEHKVGKLEQEAATADDVKQLEKLIDAKFSAIRERMDGQHELSTATNRNVQRIYDTMLKRGLGG